MNYKYPVYKPFLNGNERKYVNECLESTWISSKGRFINLFEDSFSRYIEIKYSNSVCNGTVALHLALITLGISTGDEVIVPTFTYISCVNSIVYTGAIPVFVDSLPDTWQMDPEDVKKQISSRTKAIMVVHLYGHPCNMDALTEIARTHNLFIIEDCAEAFGAKYKEKHVGNFGNIATFSFFGNKTITTGEGGMVVTNDKTLYERSLHFKGQGLAKYREYWHDVIGYNYRMTNICASIGLAQLEQAKYILSKKRQIVEWYKEELKDLPISVHQEHENVVHSYWMFNILVESEEIRESLREHLSKIGIETRPTFYPIHTMPMYSAKYKKLNVAEDVSRRGISLPSYPDLSKQDINYIAKQIIKFYEKRDRI